MALCCTLGVLVATRLLSRPPAAPPAPSSAVLGLLPLRVAPEAAAKNEAQQEQTVPARIGNSIWSDGRGVVWIGGGAGRVWRSADHGRTFARVAMPVHEALVGVTGRPGGPVVMATKHAVYRSRDSGASWTLAARLKRADGEAEPELTGLYSDGTTLWTSAVGEDDGMAAVYTMALEGRHLSLLTDRYDKIRNILGRRGAVLVLNVVYNCHSGDYPVVDRLDGNGKSRRVEKGADAFIDSTAVDTRVAYMTPGGDLYLLAVAGWNGDEPLQELLRRRAGASAFRRAPLVAEALWASDAGEVLITTPHDEVRRSIDHGHSFSRPIALP